MQIELKYNYSSSSDAACSKKKESCRFIRRIERGSDIFKNSRFNLGL